MGQARGFLGFDDAGGIGGYSCRSQSGGDSVGINAPAGPADTLSHFRLRPFQFPQKADGLVPEFTGLLIRRVFKKEAFQQPYGALVFPLFYVFSGQTQHFVPGPGTAPPAKEKKGSHSKQKEQKNPCSYSHCHFFIHQNPPSLSKPAGAAAGRLCRMSACGTFHSSSNSPS
jgi:hypothetical protein